MLLTRPHQNTQGSAMISPRELRDALTRYKVTAGLSWREIAERAEVAQTTITRFVNSRGGQGPSMDTISKILEAHPALAQELEGRVETTAIPIFGYLSWNPKYVVTPPLSGQDRYVTVGTGTVHTETTRAIKAGAANRPGFFNWAIFFDEQRSVDVKKYPDFTVTGVSHLCLVSDGMSSFLGHTRLMNGVLEIYGLSSIGIQFYMERLRDDLQPLKFPIDDIKAVYPCYGMLAPGFGAQGLPLKPVEVLRAEEDQSNDTVYGVAS